MDIRLICSAVALVAALSSTSCTVDQEAALHTGASATGQSEKKEALKSENSFAEKMRIAKEEREKARAEALEQKEKELAAKKKEEADLAKKKEAEQRAAEAEKNALAEQKEREEREAIKAREAEIAKKKEEVEARKAAKLAAREKARAERDAREAASEEVPAVAERRGGGGFFSSFAVSTPNKYKSEGHHIHVNQRLIDSLNPSNAKIEIDLSEQRARVYKTGGGTKQLVIETQVSTGKSGHTTPTGSFRIKEKLVHKRSTLYGRWLSSSGATVRSDGDSRYRPAGGSRFVGAEMPYWMRVNGGIGMHIGYVPNGPASHGCIRVPSSIQPLIYSKVGVGTSVTITH